MGRYDNENVIISEARSVPAEKTCFLTKSPFERQLYRAVIKEWPKWTINNGHDNIPPDYFSCDHKLMFDVMRINDSESVITTKRGKDLLYNPVKAKERSMLHEVQSFAKEQYSPWVIVNRTLNRFMGTPNMVGIRVYTTASDEIINIQFPLQVLKDYISSRYEKLSLAISWAEESIRKAEAEWREQHIKRNVSPVEVLTSIKEVLALRYQSTGDIDDMIGDLTCPLTIQKNLASVSEYRNAIIDAIPQICDGIENLEELFNIPAYNALRELPKTMPQGTSYQLEKIFTYLDDEYATGANYTFGLMQAGDFAEGFAKKWVVICPQEMPICEIHLLVRTACYLEAQAQKGDNHYEPI